jgi:hypothetical protein
MAMRLPDVDQGQHHENEGLQQNNQYVEDGPG